MLAELRKLPVQKKVLWGGGLLLLSSFAFLLKPEKKVEPKVEVQKSVSQGFELFDSPTWIKGEKELQVLEMRALKGELEKDLCSFENIEKASVVLDKETPATLRKEFSKAKASVIVSLKKGCFLDASEIEAISTHIAAAVTGLEPARVAIADTKGWQYKTLEGTLTATLEHVKVKQESEPFLTALFGKEHYIFQNDSQEALLLVDRTVACESTLKQTRAFFKKLSPTLSLNIESLPFASSTKPSFHPPRSKVYFGVFAALFAALFILFFLRKRKKNASLSQGELVSLLNSVDGEKLAFSLKKENPQTIALLLSYLQPEKAEKVLQDLPENVQEQVCGALSDLADGES